MQRPSRLPCRHSCRHFPEQLDRRHTLAVVSDHVRVHRPNHIDGTEQIPITAAASPTVCPSSASSCARRSTALHAAGAAAPRTSGFVMTFTRGAHDRHFQTLDGQVVSRFYGKVMSLIARLFVFVEQLVAVPPPPPPPHPISPPPPPPNPLPSPRHGFPLFDVSNHGVLYPRGPPPPGAPPNQLINREYTIIQKLTKKKNRMRFAACGGPIHEGLKHRAVVYNNDGAKDRAGYARVL